jgi:hypothetical protein
MYGCLYEKGRVEMFSSREIAGFIWLSIFLIYILISKNTRKYVFEILKAFLKLTCTSLGLFIVIYIGAFTSITYYFNLLGLLFIKNYTIWIILGLFPLIDKMVTKVSTNIKEIVSDIVKFSIIPMFIINEYTFSLPVEVILLPAIVLFTLLIVVADTDEKNNQIKRISEIVLSIIGLGIVFYAFRSFIINFKDIKQASFWESMFCEVFFVFLHLPLLIITTFFIIYEEIIIRTRFDSKKAKAKAIVYLILICNVSKLKLLSVRKEFRFGMVFTYKEFKNEIKEIVQRCKKMGQVDVT